MADIILSPLVDAVIGNLVSAATNEIKMLWGVEKEVDRLGKTLSTIEEVLKDAEEKQVTSRAVKDWLRKLKAVAYEAEDIVDDFAIEALRAKLEGSIPETSKGKQVSRFFSCFCVNKVVIRHEIGLKIEGVRQRLNEIAKERHDLHLEPSKGGGPVEVTHKSGRLETGYLIDESNVIHRENDEKKLIKILMTDDDTGRNVSVLPIVGMGGSGKTTLAQLLYNDTLIKNQFEIRAWVCVSDPFDVARIIKKIIEFTSDNECKYESIAKLQEKLLEILKGKKFMLVLDDVWNKNINLDEVENLCLPLKDGAKGSKIIVTTRIDKVAQMMDPTQMVDTLPTHKLDLLSEDDSWRLFEKMAFGRESSESHPTLVNIGKQILRKCDGLPLAIKTMGALLSSTRNESRWNNILLSKIWELPEGKDDILPALRLSYHDLSTNLKQCFTYCSLFPKDYEFERDTLVELWIGEGYVKHSKGMEIEEVGQDLFEDLLSRSFFQPHEYLKCFNMHDLVHDMAEFFSKEECVKIEEGMSLDELKINPRRTSIIHREGINLIKLDGWNKFNSLRTFLKVQSDKLLEHSDDILGMLLRCKSLRVLSLPEFSINELPDSIGNLKHLRYLHLSSRGITKLPESIGDLLNLHTLNLSKCEDLKELPKSIGGLYNLQTLNLVWCKSLKVLPESIGKLLNLHTLNLSNCKDLKELPKSIGGLYNLQTLNIVWCTSLNVFESIDSSITNLIYLRHLEVDDFVQLPFGIGKMSQLVTLPCFKVGSSENECKLGELKDLVKLRGKIKIVDLDNVSNKEEAEEANLKNKEYIQKVTLEWGGGSDDLNAEEVLEGLQPHVNIRKLEIMFYSGDKLKPSWFSKFDQMITFVNLVGVYFNNCEQCKSLPPLGQLPSLKKLTLQALNEIRILGEEFCGGNGTFPSLIELTLFKLNSLEEWSGGMEGGGEYMPCLERLVIHGCPKLKQLPEKGFPTSLNYMDIRECPILEERYKKETGEDWPQISRSPHRYISKVRGGVSDFQISDEQIGEY